MATATKRRSTPPRKPAKTEYVNTTTGYVGAIVIDRKGDEKAVSVAPGTRIFLTEEEKELTGQSHAHAEDSPFEVRHIVYRDFKTSEVVGEADLCPLEPASSFARATRIIPEGAVQGG